MRFALFNFWFLFVLLWHVYFCFHSPTPHPPPPPARPYHMAHVTSRATLALHIISLGELLARYHSLADIGYERLCKRSASCVCVRLLWAGRCITSVTYRYVYMSKLIRSSATIHRGDVGVTPPGLNQASRENPSKKHTWYYTQLIQVVELYWVCSSGWACSTESTDR